MTFESMIAELRKDIDPEAWAEMVDVAHESHPDFLFIHSIFWFEAERDGHTRRVGGYPYLFDGEKWRPVGIITSKYNPARHNATGEPIRRAVA